MPTDMAGVNAGRSCSKVGYFWRLPELPALGAEVVVELDEEGAADRTEPPPHPRLGGGARSVKLLRKGKLKSYPGLPHGMPTTHAEMINADLLEFIQSK